MKKRLMSLVLSICVLFAGLPIPYVSAADPTVVKSASLSDIYNEADATVQLLSDGTLKFNVTTSMFGNFYQGLTTLPWSSWSYTKLDLGNVKRMPESSFVGKTITAIDGAELKSISAGTFKNCTLSGVVTLPKLQTVVAGAFEASTVNCTFNVPEAVKEQLDSALPPRIIDTWNSGPLDKGVVEYTLYSDNSVDIKGVSGAVTIESHWDSLVRYKDAIRELRYFGSFHQIVGPTGFPNLETVTASTGGRGSISGFRDLPKLKSFKLGGNFSKGLGTGALDNCENLMTVEGLSADTKAPTGGFGKNTPALNHLQGSEPVPEPQGRTGTWNTVNGKVTLTADGTLTFTGTSTAISGVYPWTPYITDIKKVLIDVTQPAVIGGFDGAVNLESVESKGIVAAFSNFKGAAKLKTITVPKTSNVIVYGGAFSGCTSLTELPDCSYSKIQGLAVANTGITEVTLSNTIIEASAFAYSPIKKITLNKCTVQDEGLAYIDGLEEVETNSNLGTHAMAATPNLKKITIKEGVTALSGLGLAGNENTELNLETELTVLGKYGLWNLYIPGVEIPTNLVSIENLGLYGYESEEVILPDTLKTLGSSCFENAKLGKLEVPSSVTSMSSGQGQFKNCDIGELKFNASVPTLYSYAASGAKIGTLDFSGSETLSKLEYNAFDSATIGKLIFRELATFTTVPRSVFNKASIKEIVFPGVFPFSETMAGYMSSQTKLTLGGGSIYMDDDVFTIEGDLTSTGTNLTTMWETWPKTKIKVAGSIPENTFKNQSINYFDVSEVTRVGTDAFNGAKILDGPVDLNFAKLVKVGDRGFYNISGVRKLSAEALEAAGDLAFGTSSTNTIEEFNLSDDVVFTGTRNFSTQKFKKFTGLKNLKTIPDNMFLSAGSKDGEPVKVDFPNVIKIGASAFSGSNLSPLIGSTFKAVPGTDAFKNIQAPVRCSNTSYIYNYCTVNAIPVDAYTAVDPSSITLDKESDKIALGKQLKLIATIKPAIATETSLTWSSTSPAVATVNSSGVVTAVSEGKTIITVLTENGLYAECEITVTGAEKLIDSISVSNVSVQVGKTSTVTPTVTPADATNKEFDFSSSDTSIFTVDASGKVKGISVGEAKLTVASTDGSNVTTEATVTVTEKTDADLTLTVDTEEPTNEGVAITATGNEEVVSITLPSGAKVSGNEFVYNVTRNGKYAFQGEDEDGAKVSKSLTISNIDKTPPVLKINSTYTESGTKYEVSATDVGSGVAFVELPDGTEVEPKDLPAEFTKEGAGDVSFVVTDKAGNVTVKDYNRQEITIPGGTTSTFYAYDGIPTDWTNQDVKISVVALNPTDKVGLNLSVKENEPKNFINFRTLAASGTNVSDKVVSKNVTLKANGEVDVELIDGLGGTHNETIEVEYIDKGFPTATASVSGSTITVEADDALSGVKEIVTPSGEIISGETAVFENTTGASVLTFLITDYANNTLSFEALAGESTPLPGEDTNSGGPLEGDIPIEGEVEPDDGTTPGPGTNPPGGGGNGSGEEVTDAMISVPAAISFLIKSDRSFVTSDVEFETKTERALTVKVTGITPLNGSETAIIAPDAHEDWTSLTPEQSKAGMALKLGDTWLNNTGGTIVSLTGNQKKKVRLSGKYGNKWGDTRVVMQYALSYSVE